MKHFKGGDILENISQLYIQYYKDVYKYLLSLTHNVTTAEDLTSETFLKALQSIWGFRGESSIKTWLLGIARNLWLQSLRDSPENLSEDFVINYLEYNTEEFIHNKNLAEYINNLLQQKDMRTQEIVKMRIDGYSYREISEKFGITEGSARVIDFRTKNWLKEQLKKEGLP